MGFKGNSKNIPFTFSSRRRTKDEAIRKKFLEFPFKSFRVGIVFRVAILCASLAIGIYAILETHLVITSTVLIATTVFIVINLIWYIERANDQVSRFLMSIQHSDFSKKVSPFTGKSFLELNDAFNLISKRFEQLSADKEAQYHYLQSIVEHVHTGLFTYDESGRMMLYNRTAGDLFQIPYMQNIIELEKRHPSLFYNIQDIKPGEKKLIHLERGFQQLQLTVSKVHFKIKGDGITLVSLQNIDSELNEKETDAWQRLIKVLTHEIMNSITPIVSLSSSMVHLVESEGTTQKDLDLKIGLSTIETRSKGLLNFVDSYRTLTRIPEPKLQKMSARLLFENVSHLLQKTFQERHISFETVETDPNIELNIDPELMEQVLINLILNAIEAVKEKDDGAIKLIARKDVYGKTALLVTDNGVGISNEIIDKIFIPFFTTKKDGSGIGLSLSQQIVKMHSGNITIRTFPGQGSSFMISF